MSWIEKIKSEFTIICGDGEPFKPTWLNATKSVEYNVAEFEFPNIAGTLVSRGTPKGRKYNLEFYFQGDDHLDQAQKFETSANDSRAWTIEHPFYGSITVQPTGLLFDNTKYNVSKITGTVIETITEDSPKATVVPEDKIIEDKEATDELLSTAYANEIEPQSEDINQMTDNVAALNADGKKVATGEFAEGYFNAFNTANSAISNATAEPLAAIRAIQAMINAPALFQQNVNTRINLLSDQSDKLRNSLENAVTKGLKNLYQNNAATLISAMALASATPLAGDYGNRDEVLSVVETLLSNYNQYINDLDTLQTENGGKLNSFIPNPDPLIALNNLINFTVSNLFKIALNSRQERAVILEDDSNIIILTHRFYGLDVDDSMIDDFIKNNNIGLNELMGLRKGRKVIYYI